MNTQALTPYQFTLESAIAEWAEVKRTRSGSERTRDAYRDTVQEFRAVLGSGQLDMLSDAIDVARVAQLWANTRLETSRLKGDVSPSTYNLRLAILSSFYAFLRDTYKMDVPNPIESVKKRPVQAYASAQPLDPETVIDGLESINRGTLEGMRDYALLAIALATGRRAHELVSLQWQHVKIVGKRNDIRVTLTFAHCKGSKVMKDTLDEEVATILLEYLRMQYGKDLSHLPGETPLWVSYSRRNSGQAITAKTLSNICRSYMGTGQVHALRHTFAVGMMRSGAPITELAGRLGHTDIKVTSIYAREILKDDNPYAKHLTARFGFRRKSAR
jgi:integrase/recombinase XerD